MVNGGSRLRGRAGKTSTPQTLHLRTPQQSRHLPSCGRLLRHRLKRFRLEPPVLFQQNLHFAFRLFQFLATGGGKLHAFFKECQGLLQRHFSFFQFLNNLLQSLKALFKLSQRWFLSVSLIYCNQNVCPVISCKNREATGPSSQKESKPRVPDSSSPALPAHPRPSCTVPGVH